MEDVTHDVGPAGEKHEIRRQKNREAVARWRAANREKVAASAKARREADIERYRQKDRESKARWREANPEESRARANRYSAENREAAKARSATWRSENPDRVKALAERFRAKRKERWGDFLASERKRYHANPRKKLDRQLAEKSANPAKFIAARRRHYLKHKPKFAARWAAYRASLLRAMPRWADRDAIAAIYREAQRISLKTGIPHDVDHIIPLRGKIVCGLHIPVNLRIITATENRRKHNRLIDAGEADRPGIPTALTICGIPPAQGEMGLHRGTPAGGQERGVRDGSDRPRATVRQARGKVLVCVPDLFAVEGDSVVVPQKVYGSNPRD